jgi:DNA-binding transcriptional LysR family regulator
VHHKKIERLLLFVEVARQLSFTKAAESLEMSRGYLSTQIKQLEKELGYPLLIRSTRTVRLTAQGEQIKQGMEGIKQDLLHIERTIDYENAAVEGVIRFTAPLQLAQSSLADMCAEFSRLHPKVSFEIECSYNSYNLVKDNFDCAFRATQSPPENLVAKHLFHYQRILVAAPEYLSSREPIVAPAQLQQHQCLTGQGVETWEFSGEEVPIQGWLTMNDNHILKQQVIEAHGLMMAPDYYVAKELRTGRLTQVLVEHEIWSNDVYLLYPPMANRSNKLNTFIEFAQNYFS